MLDHLAIAKGRQMRNAQINADILVAHRKFLRLFYLTRKGDIPVINLTFDGDDLDLPCEWTVKLDFHFADLGEMQILAIELPACTIRIGERVIAVATLETWEPWILASLATSKEALKGPVKPT